MAQKTFEIGEENNVKERVRAAIALMRGERLNNPLSHVYNGTEFYHINGIGVCMLYNGDRMITIGADTNDFIADTRSKLEKLSKEKLRVVR